MAAEITTWFVAQLVGIFMLIWVGLSGWTYAFSIGVEYKSKREKWATSILVYGIVIPIGALFGTLWVAGFSNLKP